MGIETATLAIGAAGALAGAGTSYAAAKKQNKAAKASEDAAKRAAAVERKQIEEASRQRALEASRQSRRNRGRLAAAAAARGVSAESLDPLIIENDLNTQQTIDRISSNDSALVDRSNSELRAALARIRGATVDPFTETGIGGLQGFNTGLSIGGALEGLESEQEALARSETVP